MLKPECYQISVVTVPVDNFPFELILGGKKDHRRRGRYDVYFYRNENGVIWGMTANILFSSLHNKEYHSNENPSSIIDSERNRATAMQLPSGFQLLPIFL